MNAIAYRCYFINKNTFECVWKETPENCEKDIDCDKNHSGGLKT